MDTEKTTLAEINDHLKFLVNETKFKRVFLRGIVNGLATAFGATIIFAILLFIAARIISGIGTLPIINDFLEATRLDVLIEKQIKLVTQEKNQNNQQQSN